MNPSLVLALFLLPAAREGRWGDEAESWPYVQIEIEALRYDVHREMR